MNWELFSNVMSVLVAIGIFVVSVVAIVAALWFLVVLGYGVAVLISERIKLKKKK